MRATTVLVLGCGDVGSAVAHRLFTHHIAVLVCDLPQPTHARRGMAFADALFDGEAHLAGVTARRVEAIADVPAWWQTGGVVPVATFDEASLIKSFQFDGVVDAVMRRGAPPPDRRSLGTLAVGLGPGHVPGETCHVAVETQWGDAMGTVLRDRGPAPK